MAKQEKVICERKNGGEAIPLNARRYPSNIPKGASITAPITLLLLLALLFLATPIVNGSNSLGSKVECSFIT
jgi:hypothetical protein